MQVHPVLMVIGLVLFNGEGKTISFTLFPSALDIFVPCNHVDITGICFFHFDVWFVFIEG